MDGCLVQKLNIVDFSFMSHVKAIFFENRTLRSKRHHDHPRYRTNPSRGVTNHLDNRSLTKHDYAGKKGLLNNEIVCK